MIFIVEDDSSIRELEQYALQSNGYDARGCEDAASFWAAVREARPELVILDVMLPDEDGYQILNKLRADPACAHLPVIMVTAKTSEIDVVKGLDHGALLDRRKDDRWKWLHDHRRSDESVYLHHTDSHESDDDLHGICYGDHGKLFCKAYCGSTG